MSSIKTLHSDLLGVISGIKQSSQDFRKKAIQINVFKYINIWDNQFDEDILGDNYAYHKPAVFIEITLGIATQLGYKVSAYPDTKLTLHIIGDVLDGGNGSMERNLPIFDLRDLIKSTLLNCNISNCSSFQIYEEFEDYKHKNTYHYRIAFKTSFLDTIGSIFDPNSGYNTGMIGSYSLIGNDYYIDSMGNTYGSSLIDYIYSDGSHKTPNRNG